MNHYYAGIGSREAPEDILELMSKIGRALQERGYILRSGGARGSDKAFAKYVDAENSEIYRPEDSDDQSEKIAARVHLDWDSKSEIAKKLLGRNAKIILGNMLDCPVDFVVAWTKTNGGSGTGNAIRIAREARVRRIFNLNREQDILYLKGYLNID